MSSNFLLTCSSNDAAVPTIMFRPLAHAGTLNASRLVTNVDETPSKLEYPEVKASEEAASKVKKKGKKK